MPTGSGSGPVCPRPGDGRRRGPDVAAHADDGPATPIGPAEVAAAAERLRGVAHRTPVITSATLDRRVGAELLCKAENLQRAGAFKFRGAYNAVAALDPDTRSAGVLAFSSGNHAQAIALAARLHEVPATIVMPHDAPAIKLAATRGYGAEIVAYDRYTEDRAEIGARLAAERGATLIPPYDHAEVMAGQGTAARELVEDAGAPDVLVVPVGGGGLISGCASGIADLAADTRVVGVEPAVRTAGRESLAAGQRLERPVPRTIADGQQTPSLGRLPFAVIQARVERIVGVEDAEIVAAMRLLLERTKLVVEPSGASALAAVLAGRVDVADRRVGLILSGGNVAADRLGDLLG